MSHVSFQLIVGWQHGIRDTLKTVIMSCLFEGPPYRYFYCERDRCVKSCIGNFKSTLRPVGAPEFWRDGKLWLEFNGRVWEYEELRALRKIYWICGNPDGCPCLEQGRKACKGGLPEMRQWEEPVERAQQEAVADPEALDSSVPEDLD